MFIKKIFNKKGYTIPFALGLLLFFFALGASMLVSSFVNVKNSNVDYKQNQAYLYTRSFIDIMEDRIYKSGLNQSINEFVKVTNKRKGNKNYQNEYKFTVNSNHGSAKQIINPLNGDIIDVEMEVTYVTKLLKGRPIVNDSENFKFNVSDTIDVVYKVKTRSSNTNKYIYQYEIMGKYYCSAIDKDIDGSEKIVWALDKYLKEIFLLKN